MFECSNRYYRYSYVEVIAFERNDLRFHNKSVECAGGFQYWKTETLTRENESTNKLQASSRECTRFFSTS